MTRQQRFRALILSIAIWVVLVSAPSAFGQSDQLRIDYTVAIKSLDDQLFHVTADVKNIRQPRLDLSLPVWTPGWYTIENYAKNILRFHVTDEKGARLPHSMVRKQTWRVDTAKLSRIKVEFDYRATVLALNQARIAKDYAFFTGIQLFLQAEGHRNRPSTVRFSIPEGWKIVSALKEAATPLTFEAPDYDTLVDAPTIMGNFDYAQFEVEGKRHHFTAIPAGAFSKEKIERFTKILTKIAQTQRAIFGDLPYDKYVYFYLFARPESNAGGALEHQNSFIAFAPPGEFATPEMLAGTAAHEFFHLWNVKRLRPAEMWPYDYSRENESPLLWFSEGFTNYFTALTLLRAGLSTTNDFLQSASRAASGVESNEARHYISPADASTSTWLGYDTPVAFDISYYTQGQNLGALLDLSMLHDSNGKARLDDLMRSLYRDFYLKGKGFTTQDFIAALDRLTNQSYSDFYRRYIGGVEVPPYDKIFGYAGYRLDAKKQRVPAFDIDIDVTPAGIEVTRVPPNSPAAEAGLVAGDILLAIEGVELQRGFGPVQAKLAEKIDQPVAIAIRRDGKQQQVTMKVEGRDEIDYKLVEVTSPTPEQLKIRELWLKR